MIELKSMDLKKEVTDKTLVIPVCEDKSIHDNRTISALIKKAMKFDKFKGKKDTDIIFHSPDFINAETVIFTGIGKAEKLDCEALRKMAGKAVKACIKQKGDEIVFAAPSEEKTGIAEQEILESIMEGAFLGNHIFDRFKKDKKQKPLEKIILFANKAIAKKHKSLASKVMTICSGTIMARQWVTLPSNMKKPVDYAKSIAEEALKAGLEVTILNEDDLKKLNFGAMLAVAKGSQSPPRLVVLRYNAKEAEKTIAFVGKGVTFDSGGLNLKPGQNIYDMKLDMAGSAAVAASLISLGALKLPFNLVGVLPLVENMPSGSATRPGDIVKTYEGRTVEIENTDAEGRLILIDAISWAIDKFKPDMLIDIATLTGACMVALGERIAGVFSNDDKLASAIAESGKKTFERCWPMPMPEDYRKYLKSDFADIKNMSSSKWGGALTAAIFLSHFVKDTKWAHIDLAGPAYAKKGHAYCGPGGTGFGVRIICHLLQNFVGEK